eukprot:TRINITY_DN44919_c0_g1_i1.p1 TRINITY_DN44919_c0_g1~~TRINITY_DN44919_c0_g1_i1.p1  ORF type:complete len:708 (-),score=130.24 TRINITY_DN44919_c0_g1_i1:116-2239(-)
MCQKQRSHVSFMSAESSAGASFMSLNSSPHGEERRNQRKISKRDLQEAVKYGTKEVAGYGQGKYSNQLRYKFTYKDVVFIIDETGTVEVTSYALPLPLNAEKVTQDDIEEHDRWKLSLQRVPELITSHTVLVVDQSASMRNSDVWEQPSRSRAVYYALACEFVGKRLRAAGRETGTNAASLTDAISVIEMRDNALLTIDFEPMSWVLYNKLVERANNYKKQQAYGHGNYVPALRLAQEQLRARSNPQSMHTLGLLFLSDGGPSDACRLKQYHTGCGSMDLVEDLKQLMRELVPAWHRKRLVVNTLGFGSDQMDFTVLEEMAAAACAGGIKAAFTRNRPSDDALGANVSSFVTSMLQTHTLTSKLREGSRTTRNISPAKSQSSKYPEDWEIFGPDKKVKVSRRLYDQNGGRWYLAGFRHEGAVGFAKRKHSLGEGAERVVFEAYEIDAALNRVGDAIVVKESRFVEDITKAGQFHIPFLATQHKAANLARKFNVSLDTKLKGRLDSEKVPRIDFLRCAVFEYFDSSEGCNISFLMEDKIDHKQYQKWNDNKGGVHGQRFYGADFENAFGMPAPAFEGQRKQLEVMIEGEDEDEDDEMETNLWSASRQFEPISDEDVPQAFTHWTYRISKRSKMVCDLQGVLDKTCKPPMFLLTDPCIHSSAGYATHQAFGRTDCGDRGMHKFFATHKCNALCRILGIDSFHSRRDWTN